MTFWLLKTVLRDNWHLAALLAGVLAIGGYLQFVHADVAASAAKGDAAASAAEETAPPLATQQRQPRAARAREVIAKHRARLEEDPAQPDAPALLSAMGNLYRQKLGDYPNAIQCYERLVHDYPDWPGVRNTLIQLSTCYERVGDSESRRRIYKEMMRLYPHESQEYLYAQHQLGE